MYDNTKPHTHTHNQGVVTIKNQVTTTSVESTHTIGGSNSCFRRRSIDCSLEYSSSSNNIESETSEKNLWVRATIYSSINNTYIPSGGWIHSFEKRYDGIPICMLCVWSCGWSNGRSSRELTQDTTPALSARLEECGSPYSNKLRNPTGVRSFSLCRDCTNSVDNVPFDI